MAKKKGAPERPADTAKPEMATPDVTQVSGLGAIQQPGGTEPTKEEEAFGNPREFRDELGKPHG